MIRAPEAFVLAMEERVPGAEARVFAVPGMSGLKSGPISEARAKSQKQEQISEARANLRNKSKISKARAKSQKQEQISEARANLRSKSKISEARAKSPKQEQISEARAKTRVLVGLWRTAICGLSWFSGVGYMRC
jgi:phosphate starvation-inducible protein PhoH